VIDPRTRLALVLCAGILAISLDRPLSLAIFALLCMSPLLWLRVSGTWWRRGLLAALTITWSTVLSQGLFYAQQPRVALFVLGPLVLWREGVLWGLAQSLRFVGLSMAGIALAASTSSDRLHAAMMALRLPFALSLMATTALRFLPELGRELWTVRRARAARGRPAWRRSPWAWLVLEVSLLRPVVARAWRRAQSLAESLDARGFDPLRAQKTRHPLRFRWPDVVVLAAALVLTGGVATARLLTLLYTSDTLYLAALRPLYSFVRGWL